MLRLFRHMVRLRRAQDGASAIEFAIVGPVFIFLIYSIIELGMIMFAASVIESATSLTTRTARVGNDGGTGDLVSYIREQIREKSMGLMDADKILITTDLVTSYGSLPKPERCLVTPPPPVGTCPPGAPFEDANSNGVYDGTMPALSLGGPNDIIRLRTYYPAPILSPLTGVFMSENGEFVISSTTMVRNEPF